MSDRSSGRGRRGSSRRPHVPEPNANANDMPRTQNAASLAQYVAHASSNPVAGPSSSASAQYHFSQLADPSYTALLHALSAQHQSPPQMQDPFRQHQHQSHRLPHPEHELPPFLQHSQQQWRPDPQTEAYNAGMLAALQGASRIQQQHFIPPGITHSAPQIQHQIPSPYQQQQSISPAIPSPSQMSSPSASGSTQGQSPENQGDDDTGSMMDDKRRRNTAASARFRVKKKQRTQNLERQVSELRGRAEELEREAHELRRENGWLKEIVMLKDSRHQEASPGASSSSFPPPPSNVEPAVESDREKPTTPSSDKEGDDVSAEHTEAPNRKGKGKLQK